MSEPENAPGHPHWTMVLIEDEDAIREMYKIKFESSGFTVFDASNGKDGLALVRDKKPNVVVLDIMMPGMNGFEVLEAIKKDENKKIHDIPVVLLTNLAEDAGHERGIKAGAASYVMKVSRTPEQLVQLVSAVITSAES